jgi:hypothetical protein
MKISKHLYALAIAGACATSAYGQYTLTFNVQEVGSDVIVSASGAVNTGNWSIYQTSQTFPNINYPYIGTVSVGTGFADYYRRPTLVSPPSGEMGPASVLYTFATSSAGDYVGFSSAWSLTSELLVPANYISGNSLSGTSTYASMTLSSLGYAPTPATYIYTVGSGPTMDTIIVNISSPSPVPEASGSVAGLGLAMAGLYQLRRRKAAGKVVEG